MRSRPTDDARPVPGDPPAAIDEAWLHRDELIAYARRLLGAQGELAEDVVQEAYLRLHERVTTGEGVREARPWLFRVTRNLALDERRRSRRGEAVRTSLEIVASQPRGPLEVLQGREDARQALEGLDALPPRERRTVILDQAGLAPPAIARRMETTTNAVHQSLFRARRRLRDARAAAWGLVPLPFIRLFVRAAGSPVLDRIPALAPGSGGRLAGGAGLVGVVAAAVIGGGVVADQPVIPHPEHTRHVDRPARVSVSKSAPLATAISSGADATERAGAGTGGAVAPSSPARPAVRITRAGAVSTRRAPERDAGPEDAAGPAADVVREVEDQPETRRSPETRHEPEPEPEHEDSVSRRSEPDSSESADRRTSESEPYAGAEPAGSATEAHEPESPQEDPAPAPSGTGPEPD